MNRILVLLGALFLLAGCGSSSRNEGERQPELLDRGAEEFLAGNFSSAEEKFEKFLDQNPLSTRRAWIFTRMGLCRNGRGDYHGAINAFGRALAAGARGPIRLEILYRRAIAFNYNDMPDLALLDLEQIALEPSATRNQVLKAAEFERILGVTLIRSGEWKRGRRVLENLVHSYPETKEARNSVRLLSFQKFSIQVARCPDDESARKQIALLQKKGVIGRVEILPDRSGISVLVGDFSRYDEVVRKRNSLNALGIRGFILP